MKRKRKKRVLPEVLTPNEVELLLNSFNTRYKTSLRNKLLIDFALRTGMRISELIALKWSDIETSTGRIHIKEGKGKKDRIVYCSVEFIKELKKMNIKFNLDKDIYVFPSISGGSLNRRYLAYMIAKRGIKLGIKKRVYFHLLRHTCLTEIYKDTNNIRLVQEIAGHSDISTTMIYTHIAPEHIKEVMLKR